MTERSPGIYCRECRTEVIESSSERGDFFCRECGTTRHIRDTYRLDYCSCCELEDTLDIYKTPASLCENCSDAGCMPGLLGCLYRREITHPSECDHNFYNPTYEAGIECRWCGYVTSGGPSGNEYGESWPTKRQHALERDNYECVLCGIEQDEHRAEYDVGLHVHHITPYREFVDDDEAHRLNNLASVCKECHKKLEPLSPAEQQDLLDSESDISLTDLTSDPNTSGTNDPIINRPSVSWKSPEWTDEGWANTYDCPDCALKNISRYVSKAIHDDDGNYYVGECCPHCGAILFRSEALDEELTERFKKKAELDENPPEELNELWDVEQ